MCLSVTAAFAITLVGQIPWPPPIPSIPNGWQDMVPALDAVTMLAVVTYALIHIFGRKRVAPDWRQTPIDGPASKEERRAERSIIRGRFIWDDLLDGLHLRGESGSLNPVWSDRRVEVGTLPAPRLAVSGSSGITVDRLDTLLEIQEFLQASFPLATVKRIARATAAAGAGEDEELRRLHPWDAELFSVEIRNYRTYHLALTDAYLAEKNTREVLADFLAADVAGEMVEAGPDGCLWLGTQGIHMRPLASGPFE